MRAGFEAMAAATPLVVSDTQALRDYFGDAALYTDHRPESIGDAARRAIGRRVQSGTRLDAMAVRRAAEFTDKLLVLRREIEATVRYQSSLVRG